VDVRRFFTKIEHFLKERLLRGRDLAMLEGVGVPEFWEAAHQQNAHLWLTGSDPDEVLDRLGIKPLIVKLRNSGGPARVLDVGVGEGRMARHLSAQEVRHDALDISPTAVARASQWCERGFTSTGELPSDTYDVIMHHLVAQHMSHRDLEEQIRSLVNSLRKGGVLALQYSATDSLAVADSDDEQHQKMGAVTRNPEWFAGTAARVGAAVNSDRQTDSFGDITFRVVHLSR
jgi:SAM-dependent methyltransferase